MNLQTERLANDGLRFARELIKHYGLHQKNWSRERKRQVRFQIENVLHTCCELVPSNPNVLNQTATFLHNVGSLQEAGYLYADLLDLDTNEKIPRDVSEVAVELAPELYLVESEPFALRDCVAIVHPKKNIIGYHLLWEDDWDFPDDYEPSDHEIIWVEYEATSKRVKRVLTYFHGHVLPSTDCETENGRIHIFVQWGKHGSLPTGYKNIRLEEVTEEYVTENVSKTITTLQWLERDYKHSQKGGRASNHSIKKQWPDKFSGEFKDYLAFKRKLDTRDYVQQPNRIHISKWANAILYEKVLPYNFHAKKEWPDCPLVLL